MDHVGLAASVITILRLILFAITKGPTIIRWFLSDVKRDFNSLQDDVKRFRSLLADIKSRTLFSPLERINDVDLAFQDIVRRLDEISKSKISCYYREFIMPTRLALVLHIDKIRGLESSLRKLKDDLQTVASAESLVESKGAELDMGFGHRGYIVAKDSFSHSVGARAGRPLIKPAYHSGFASNSEVCTDLSPINSGWPVHRLPASQPIGMLESSRTFFPESYTSKSQMPDILVFGHYEKISTTQSHTNFYRLLYFQNCRNWKVLSVTLEVPRSSDDCKFTKISQCHDPRPNALSPSCVPRSMLMRIRQGLDTLGAVKEASHVQFRVPTNGQRDLTVARVTMVSTEQHTRMRLAERAEQVALAALYHMGCPIVDERRVARLFCTNSPDRFSVSIDGQMVEEVMSMHRPPEPNFFNTIRLLYRLRGKRGFPDLVGVTVEAASNHIKSYLVKWPETACQFLLHRASNRSLPCSWRMVEQWSRQLLQKISVVHAQGDVVGTLRYQRPPILVDAFNHIHLSRFESRVDIGPTCSPFYPPEFRYLAQSSDEGRTQTEEGTVTPAYDVYQCGQILWMLATGWASDDKTPLKLKADFYSAPKAWDCGFWFGPDPLPRLPQTIPAWYQEVVDACCALLPGRLSCLDVLAKFPPSRKNEETEATLIANPQPYNKASMRACQVECGHCDICLRQIDSLIYQCFRCGGGDFEVCLDCFNEGKHCKDAEHLLFEVRSGSTIPTAAQCFSSPDSCGKRKQFAV
ncbi:hypothetical protein CC86DRAFT_421419 [Ophiobolus disseminans]|uniref:Protein kinase domain-containing protein n=1 Tax=Ophiobolus disseminans TaxID=1469910 RepID=A0A6A6ZT73_9PLEO|nr:hypothetical protein CC86DRAFT_421419 [Ophiobolus disseminans]